MTAPKVRLELEPPELDLIATVLMKQPWKKVNPLLQKILSQANDPALQGAKLSPVRPKPPAK